MLKHLFFLKFGLGLIISFASFNTSKNVFTTKNNLKPDHSLAQAAQIKVYLFLLDECRITQELVPELNNIYDKFGDQVEIIGVFPNFSSKKENIETFKKDHHITFDTKTDYFKKLSVKFDIQVLPEGVIVNSNDIIIYKGAINSLFIARGRRIKTKPIPHLYNAIQAAITNPELIQKFHPAVGCAVNYADNLK